jgi:transposase
MPKTYSYDFRQKVIEAIELNGYQKRKVSQMFKISRNTINLWLKRKKETGDFQAFSSRPKTDHLKIDNGQKFRDFVKVNGDKTQEEMASLWKGEISPRTRASTLSI